MELNWRSFAFILIFVTVQETSARGCEFCGVPVPSLSERVESADVALLVRFIEGEKPSFGADLPGTTRYEIQEVIKGPADQWGRQEIVTLDRYRPGSSGDLVLMLGRETDQNVKWNSLLDVSQTSIDYLKEAPGLDVPTQQRLVYFLKFLEHPDSVIANDAFSEFAIAPYKEIVPLRPLMDRQRLRKWIENPQEPPDRFLRLGLYGLMLGLSGTSEDAEFLYTHSQQAGEDYRFGMDAMTTGYLQLSGVDGLKRLRADFLTNDAVERDRRFAILQALRFLWTYHREQIDVAELRQTMRILLKSPDLADLAIIDLARWKDWEAMERIVALYDQEDYDVKAIKRAILRYLLTAEKSDSVVEFPDGTNQIQKARGHLERFRNTDPATVKSAERYFFD